MRPKKERMALGVALMQSASRVAEAGYGRRRLVSWP